MNNRLKIGPGWGCTGGASRRARGGARFLFGALVLLMGVAACGEATGTRVAADALTEVEADVVHFGMHSYLTAAGVRSGHVRADSAFGFYRDSTIVHLFGVEMSIYNERGLEHAHVVGQTGRLDEQTEQMAARGNVVVTLPEANLRIESAELYYDPQAGSIWSDAAVVVNHEGGVTSGTCFRSDLTFSVWNLCNPRGAASMRPSAPGGTLP